MYIITILLFVKIITLFKKIYLTTKSLKIILEIKIYCKHFFFLNICNWNIFIKKKKKNQKLKTVSTVKNTNKTF